MQHFWTLSSSNSPMPLSEAETVTFKDTNALPYSVAHLMLTLLGKMGDSLHWLVMLTGLGGRLGSTPEISK